MADTPNPIQLVVEETNGSIRHFETCPDKASRMPELKSWTINDGCLIVTTLEVAEDAKVGDEIVVEYRVWPLHAIRSYHSVEVAKLIEKPEETATDADD